MVAPGRLAVVRAALMTAVFAVLTVEGLGAIGRLSLVPVATAWLVFVVAALAAAALRHRRAPWRPRLRPRHWWREAGLAERLLAGTVGGLLLLELLVALLAEPNNFDSQTYHLPKVEHWVAQGSLELWPTAIHRQVTIPPGAEYLLLHLRLLTGGDGLYHLIQWGAGLGAVLLVSRITAQLGGGRRAQLLSAFVLACTPMVVLQATSTQTDLVVAAWVGVVATLVLDGLRRPANATMVLGLGAATGLTALTKTSGLLGVGPMLLFWGVVQLRTAFAGDRRAVKAARVIGASVLVLAAAAVVTGPFMARMTVEFDHPLGPPRLRESIPMQRHDPASILVNGVRIAHTALDVPVPPLTAATAAGIVAFAEAIGVDPQDRAITFGKETFPVPAWYPDEDRAAFPITGTLALIALALALIRPARLITDRPPQRTARVRPGGARLRNPAHRDDQVADLGKPAAALRPGARGAAGGALAGHAAAPAGRKRAAARRHRGDQRGAGGRRGRGAALGRLRLPAPARRRGVGADQRRLGDPLHPPSAVGRRVPVGRRRRTRLRCAPHRPGAAQRRLGVPVVAAAARPGRRLTADRLAPLDAAGTPGRRPGHGRRHRLRRRPA